MICKVGKTCTLYEYTILTNLTLLAITITIFVFIASIKGSAIKRSNEEVIAMMEKRHNKIKEIIQTLSSSSIPTAQQTKDIDQLNQDLKKIDREIAITKSRKEVLSVRNMVALPFALTTTSIIFCGIAIVIDNSFAANIIWIVALILVAITLYRIFLNLRLVDSTSEVSDLSITIDKATEQIIEAISQRIVIRAPEQAPDKFVDKRDLLGFLTVKVPDEIEAYSMDSDIGAVLRELSDQERRILMFYYGLVGEQRLTVSRIAKEFDVTEDNIDLTISKALRKLRHPSRSRRFRKYLDKIPVITGERSGAQQFIVDIFDI